MPRPAKKISLDSAFKLILRDSGIPTQKDIATLNAKIDRLEKMVKTYLPDKTLLWQKQGVLKLKGNAMVLPQTWFLQASLEARRVMGLPIFRKKLGLMKRRSETLFFVCTSSERSNGWGEEST